MASKTIRELAEDLQVSKSYIDKIIRSLSMHTELDKVGNKYVISKVQQKLISEQITSNKKDKLSNTSTHTIEYEKMGEEVDFLRNQLKIKANELERMQKLLDQQQQLQLKTQEMLEEKTLLLETEKSKRWWKFWS
ncbi:MULTISPECIES: DUF536 domain-containing protein [unclassified Lactococcus]|uniref:DUF536 domain-containing protein n=1 Tax=unclassified Lactococcus TaxID=2643510 RepID=UPI0011C79E4A|nr:MULTISPECIES: DUF536 domain-containing protein [unclassified Lactococcus]MQW24078.1 replication-like protein [Lactococcus sp. dk101]TXK36733.1 replication-like protein [Lactococcus sp. dk310]TXK36740.1 replication-like protein [Lactococcus sp. dk310]TXK46110.1 replication-like protein [Lactococcus sp. dk322]